MTYIKWKDEVESYLGNLSDGERQKVLSYFAEMYADKRDAGKSEEQIIEEFGAPYDVAKRILADSKDSPPEKAESGNVNGANSGGNNYNYNYYNYNYGAAPQSPPPSGATNASGQNQADPFAKGLNIQPEAEKPKKEKGNAAVKVILTILLVAFTIFLIGISISLIVDGFTALCVLLVEIAAGKSDVALKVANIGTGIMTAAAGFILLAPFSALIKILWQKLKKY